jgi:hypothetical protein
VVAWGFGEVTNVPVAFTDAVAIAPGDDLNLVLRADGTVYCWGNNAYGQVDVPSGLSDVVAIAVGLTYCMALIADGTVVMWGSSTTATNVPAGLSNVVAIASGIDHCLALRADGTVVAWGQNDFGQTNVPSGLANVTAISAGGRSSVALVGEAPAPLQSPLVNPSFGGNGFTAQLQTQSGRVYRLEYKDSLQDADWTALPLVAGNGGMLTLTDFGPTSSQRYYRVRRW